MSAGTISGGTIASAVTGTLGSGITFPAGHILQTVQVVKTDTWTHAANTSTFYFITGMEKSITLSNASNKVLVTVDLMVGSADDGYLHYKVQRNTTDLTVGAVRGSCTRCMFMTNIDDTHGQHDMQKTGCTFLDDPSESTITPLEYKVYAHSGQTQYINQCHTSDDYNRGATISTMTLQEVAV
jgi:hypothetical protein